MKLLSLKRLAGFIFCMSLCSCVHQKQLETENIQHQRKIRSLETDLRKKQATIENLKEQNWILKQKYVAEKPQQMPTQSVPVPFQPSASVTVEEKPPLIPQSFVSAPTQTQAQTQAQFQVAAPAKGEDATTTATPTDSRESAEHNLYAKVIASYRHKRIDELKKVTEILLKTYPQSVFADRALYLNARLNYENANDTQALADCEKVIRQYPNANKLVSTYFLKAQILKKQGHLGEAKTVLADVQTYFPGSPESFRVPLELKLLALQEKATK